MISTESRPSTFRAVRQTDVTGVSGSGHIADGVVFPDGTTVLRWRTETASTAVYGSFDDMKKIHGHNGATEFVFDDSEQWFRMADVFDAWAATFPTSTAFKNAVLKTVDEAIRKNNGHIGYPFRSLTSVMNVN